jgi:hypothetical protein
MTLPSATMTEWIPCPRCHVANIAGSLRCAACGAALGPNVQPLAHPSGASLWQWASIIGASVFLIGSALWAGLAPGSVAALIYERAIPVIYVLFLISLIARAVRLFRRGNLSGGIMVSAVTVLVALAILPAVVGSHH